MQSKDTPHVMQTTFPQIVMDFGCVSSEEDVIPSHFSREGMNSGAYVMLLNTLVKPWITTVVNGRSYVWQQDSCPCYTSRKSFKCLSANLYDYASPNVWPKNSPDLNPMDYYIWRAVEKDTNLRAVLQKPS